MEKITKTELTGQQLISEVKRINQRYKDIVKSYGEQNELAKTYRKWFNEISTTEKTKTGTLAIKKPSKLTEEDIKVIKRISKLYTKGEYKKAKKELYKKVYGKEPSKVTQLIENESGELEEIDVDELNQFIKESSDLHEFIVNNGTYIYNADTTLKSALKRSGTLTSIEYGKLLEVYKKYQSGVDIGTFAKQEKAKEQKASIPTGTIEE